MRQPQGCKNDWERRPGYFVKHFGAAFFWKKEFLSDLNRFRINIYSYINCSKRRFICIYMFKKNQHYEFLPKSKFQISKIIAIFVVLLVTYDVTSQTINQFKYPRTIEEEIGLLPDTKSYVAVEENFKGELLVNTRTDQTFYNYGDIRHCFHTDYKYDDLVERMLTLMIKNAKKWVQTRIIFHDNESTTQIKIIRKSKFGVRKIKLIENGKSSRSMKCLYSKGRLKTKIYYDLPTGITENQLLVQ